MLRKLLLPAAAVAMLAGCATGYSYRGGSGDYYYGQPRVEYRYYGGYGYGYGASGFGMGYYRDIFGRPIYGYPYGYYGGSYPGYPYRYPPRPPHGHGPGGHDGGHGEGPPADGDHRPGNRPPWRDIGRIRDREQGEDARPRRPGLPGQNPPVQRPAPRMRASAPAMAPPAMRERSASPAARTERGGGSGARARSARPSADE